jgi:putative NADPH-quinone reductase
MEPDARALVVVSHPDPLSFSHALAGRIAVGFADAGLQVDLLDLHAVGFDPCLTLEEARGQASSDPMVRAEIARLTQAVALGVVHPNCWGAPPAMMKGWMDRVFAPEAAYSFEKGADAGDAPRGLLRTRAALVLNTSNTPPEREREVFGDPLEAIWRRCLLNYCGISDVERRTFSVLALATGAERAAWLAQAESQAAEIGRRAMGAGGR